MRKLLLVLVLALPLAAQAALQGWTAVWDTSPEKAQPPGTMAHVKCGLNGGAKVEVGNVASEVGSLDFEFGTVGVPATVECVLFPTHSGVVGVDSEEGSAVIPLALRKYDAPTLKKRPLVE